MVSVPLLAQTAAKPKTSTTTTTTTTTTAKPKAKKKPAAMAKKPMAKPTTATEMQTLRDAVSAQQQQIQMLRDEIARRDAAMQQVQQQVNSLQSQAQQAQTAAQASEACCKTNEDALAALRTNVTTVETKTTAFEKRVKGLEEPTSIHYKGIKITPGGFVALYGFWRKANTNADATSTLGGFPLDNSSNAHLSEFRITPRHSNLSLAADGETHGLKTRAYFEIDFEGAAATANETISSSFTPRIREGWVNVTTQSGLSFLGGQTWSLLTPNRSGIGIGPNGELRPATVDASYLVGYHYARLGTFRITKNFNNKTWLAFSVENPEAAIKGTAPTQAVLTTFNPGSIAATILWNGSSGSCCAFFNAATAVNLSIDAAPDFVGKVAFEPGWGHYEIGAIGRVFRDRVVTNTALANGGHNNLVGAGGVTVNAVLPVVPKKVDILLQTLAGVGIGRYGPSGGVDAVFKPNGDIEPVKGGMAMFGIETHPTPTTDFYLYAGAEYYKRTVYSSTIAPALPVFNIGYGIPTANQIGCFTEGGTCAGDNKAIFEVTPVLWHSFYKGPAGTFRMGLEYEFLRRALWRGIGGPGVPKGDEHVIMTAVRWFFP
jgi:hypothetical protein